MHLPPEVLSILLEAHLTPEQLALVKRAMAILVAPVEEARVKATIRQQACRARKKDRVTSRSRDGHVTVTSTEPSKINRVARVEDNLLLPLPLTTTGKGADAPSPSVVPPPKPVRAKPRTPLPEDWRPTEAGLAFARERIPADLIEEEVQRFCDHHTAHHKLMADWPAAWRTWCGNYAGFNKATGRPVNGHARTAPHTRAEGWKMVDAVIAEARRRESDSRADGASKPDSQADIFQLPRVRKGPA